MLKLQNYIWPECLWVDGKRHTVKALIADNTFKGFHLGVCGNSEEGWALYIFRNADRDQHQQVSPLFDRNMGDTLKDLLDATERAYGVRLSPRSGKALNFLPADELWLWHTEEPTASAGTHKAIAPKSQRKAARKLMQRHFTFAAGYRADLYAWLSTWRELGLDADAHKLKALVTGCRYMAHEAGFRLP